MYDGPTPTKFGLALQAPVFEAERALFHAAQPLREVTHAIPLPVLDQEDLAAQGIDTSALVPGARRADALGSCTAQSSAAHIAERWAAAGRDIAGIRITADGGAGYALSGSDATADEKFAIVFYHLTTAASGSPDTAWPPSDCGSTGQACAATMISLGLASDYVTPHNVQGCLLALQTGTVMQGLPWFNSWMQPDSAGFVDGDGSVDALHEAISSGIAGGHETCQYAIPQLAQLGNGTVDLTRTVIRIRNSWSPRFGLDGDYLIHASTLDMLSRYADYKQLVV